MSMQLLQNVGKLSINAVQNHTQASGQQWQRSSSKQSNQHGGSRNRSSSGQCILKNYGRCGRKHAPRNCPTYGRNCRCSGVKGHCVKFCKLKNSRNQTEHFSCRDTFEVSPEKHGENFKFEEDAI